MLRYVAISSAIVLSGCSLQKSVPKTSSLAQKTHSKADSSQPERDPRDPLERFNRRVFAFNTTVDKTILLPFIGFYRILPPEIKNRVISLMDTVETPISIVNCALQGKIHDCLAHTARLVFNTIFGLCGLFDIATLMKITPEKVNFSKTLQKWSIPSGPFIMVPFFGPSTVRASIGEAVDCTMLPVTYFKSTAIPYYATSYTLIQAKIVGMQDDITDTFSDPYSAMRDAYLIARGDPVKEDSADLLGDNDDATDDKEPDLLGDNDDAPDDTTDDKEPDLLS